MLSKTEKKYLDGIEEFEEQHGVEYAQVVRHRIRKRVASALEDLSYIIDRNGSGRKPGLAAMKRAQAARMTELKDPALSQEDRESTMQEARLINMLISGRQGNKKEKTILKPYKFEKLIYQLVKRDTSLGESFIELIKDAQEEVIFKNREELMARNKTDWAGYGHEWLMEYLGRHEGLAKRAGFDNVDDCIKWLENVALS